MQIVLNGLISGVSIALLAVAFQAVYFPTRVFFLGLAGIYVAVPYICSGILKSGGSWFIAAPFSLFTAILLSVFMEWLTHGPLERKGAGSAIQLIASLGYYIVLVQIVVLIWGSATRTLREGNDWTLQLGSTIVTGSQCATVGFGGGLLVGLLLLLKNTTIGLRFLALAENPVQFAQYGYDAYRYRYVGFILAGILVAVAALLAANDFGFDPYTGLRAILLAIVAVIVGGQGSFVGPIVAALSLGLIRAGVIWLASARWQEAATFCLLAFFLLFRPQGLLGKKTRLEAGS